MWEYISSSACPSTSPARLPSHLASSFRPPYPTTTPLSRNLQAPSTTNGKNPPSRLKRKQQRKKKQTHPPNLLFGSKTSSLLAPPQNSQDHDLIRRDMTYNCRNCTFFSSRHVTDFEEEAVKCWNLSRSHELYPSWLEEQSLPLPWRREKIF